MTVRTRAELNSDADTNLADNTSGDIGAADVRTSVKNLADSAVLPGDAPYLTGVELGAATDTTISRGAAGFIAVEGKRVPSPASQASGDLLYRGATEWERLAKGTAAQVLTMNAGATAPEWATASSGGMTLLASGTFTSGATNAITGLTPASYKRYLLEIDGLSHNDGSNQSLRVELSSTNGAAYGSAVTVSAVTSASTPLYGTIEISNINSTTAAAKHLSGRINASTIAVVGSTNTGAAVNALRFSFSAGSFDATGAGLVRLYGVN